MSTFAFSVACECHQSAVARVFDVFSVYGHLPARLHAQRTPTDYVVDIECEGLETGEAERIQRRLEGLVSVSSVLISKKLGIA